MKALFDGEHKKKKDQGLSAGRKIQKPLLRRLIDDEIKNVYSACTCLETELGHCR